MNSDVANDDNITSKIQNIIDLRKPLVSEVELEAQRLESLISIISDLETHFDETKGINQEIVEQLNSINLQELKNKIIKEKQEFNKLIKRFKRETLNIGVVGIARQGKSTLLQSLSGLDNSHIPSSSGLPCTSVQSTIHNHSEKKTYGKVYFYSESEFIKEILTPYYEELKFNPIPKSLVEFKDLPTIENQIMMIQLVQNPYTIVL